MHIAIVGAGLSGLICARQLLEQGNTVIVYEKAAEAGGRMRTRQTEIGGFDHGAQYFTASSGPFKQAIVGWRKAGLVAPWSGKLVVLDNGETRPAARTAALLKQRFVAVPGMNALTAHLAQGVELRTEQAVRKIEEYGEHQWLLKIASDGAPIEASAGPFDAVIVATPATSASSLLSVVPKLADEAARVRYAPCWSLMLGFPMPLDLGYDGAWVEGSRLSWIARDSSKPKRRAGEHWVAHASGAWSDEHYEDDEERAREKLLKAFRDATGSEVQPLYVALHRWNSAQALDPLGEGCLWDGDNRIGACGDWFAAGLDGAGRIENAYLSGLAMAEALRLAVH
ncbi:MAG TPA: FAD-dependent oxidoreductase [Burkholderiaceae bacterium]